MTEIKFRLVYRHVRGDNLCSFRDISIVCSDSPYIKLLFVFFIKRQPFWIIYAVCEWGLEQRNHQADLGVRRLFAASQHVPRIIIWHFTWVTKGFRRLRFQILSLKMVASVPDLTWTWLRVQKSKWRPCKAIYSSLFWGLPVVTRAKFHPLW